MHLLLLAFCIQDSSPTPIPALTWATAGTENEHFVCADVDRDGYDDLLVRTPGGSWLVAPSVLGLKAAPWRALEEGALPLAEEALARWSAGEEPSGCLPDAPPYEPDAAPGRVFHGDLDGDGRRDTIALYRCTRPGEFYDLRVAFGPREEGPDRDGDGLSDEEEQQLGSDPADRDSDDDGLQDGWEVRGLPRGVTLAEGTRLDPNHQDVVCVVAPYEGVDLAGLPGEFARLQKLYAELSNINRDGTRGVRVHLRVDPSIPKDKQFGGDWGRCGNAYFAPVERGLLHWMQLTPWGGGQSSETSDMGGAGAGFAVFAHEFGHQLSLSHSGDSAPAWCPLYPSLMNYAFSYSLGGDGLAIRFSDGRFRATTLEEAHLSETLPYPMSELAYLASHPFRFTLEAKGPSETRIDWNQNGRFDEGTVSADVNYGSSTSCGIRRAGGPTAAAPALAYVGQSAYLAKVHTEQGRITLERYLGGEQWEAARDVPDSATNADPLLVGGGDHGYLFFQRSSTFLVARFDATSIDAPRPLAGLAGACELGGAWIAERALLVARSSDDRLRTYWLDCDASHAEVRFVEELELRSQVAPGLCEEPGTGRVVLASAMTNPAGAPLCLRVSWYERAGDRLVELETAWVRGARSGTQCSTRPTVLHDPDGQLNLFHTAIPGGNGLMTAWRTRRIGNHALDEGWLTCLLYDVWTSTRRAVSATTGPQGALYAFRWDADGHYPNNHLLLGHNAFGIDADPMRDFDDGEKISKYGLVHSILWMQPDPR